MKTLSLALLAALLSLSLRAAEPAQIELAQKVIKATQFDRIFDQMSSQMQQMAAQAINVSPDMPAAQREAATKAMNEVMALSMEAAKGMIAKVDVIYAEVYSEPELKAMLAFFDSAEGKSMLQKQPQVMQHLMPLVQGMQQELGPKIQAILLKAKAEADASAQAAPASPAAPAAPEASAPVPPVAK